MNGSCGRWQGQLLAVAVAIGVPVAAPAACCYFSAKNKDILQPAQKVFITWDPVEKVESFTVQPKFEGNALDFGMVIPTPSKPKLDEMPRDFFKELAVYSILKKREQPTSKLLPVEETWVSFQLVPPLVDRATNVFTTFPELTPAAVFPGGRAAAYAGSARES